MLTKDVAGMNPDTISGVMSSTIYDADIRLNGRPWEEGLVPGNRAGR